MTPYPQAPWRLILDPEADGAANMAVDEAILAAVAEGHSPPTLRFFAWSPPCLSLGRNQPLADVDLAACRTAGVDVVRRPTGGRAILHTDELTYSLAMPNTDPRAHGDIMVCYRNLSEGLLNGLGRLGARVEQAVEPGRSTADLSAVCFETPSNYEITAGGRKLVGSAQWRPRGGVLQHGSLPLHGDITRILDYLAVPAGEREAQRQSLRARATTLERALGRVVSFEEAAQALAQGFAEELNLILAPGELTEQERAQAAALRHSRFADPLWTEQG